MKPPCTVLALALALGACGPGPAATAPKPAASWPLPGGWRSEVIPFPLGFAPSLAHRGIEELRFAPGFFEPGTPGYWSYAFVWRLDDPAALGSDALAAELLAYFRGLIDAVDEHKRITARDEIDVVAVSKGPDRWTLTAHVFDAFKTAAPLDLVGTAERRTCGTRSLWVFTLAPSASGMWPALDRLAGSAACDQPPLR